MSSKNPSENEFVIRSSDAKIIADTLYARKKDIIKNFRKTADSGPKAVLQALKEYIAITSSDKDIHTRLGHNIDFDKSNHIFYGILLGHGFQDATMLDYDALKVSDLKPSQVQTFMIGYIMEHYLFNGQIPEDDGVHRNIEAAIEGGQLGTLREPPKPEAAKPAPKAPEPHKPIPQPNAGDEISTKTGLDPKITEGIELEGEPVKKQEPQTEKAADAPKPAPKPSNSAPPKPAAPAAEKPKAAPPPKPEEEPLVAKKPEKSGFFSKKKPEEDDGFEEVTDVEIL